MGVLIYALSDPADHRIRYVGATTSLLHRRIGRHVASAKQGKTTALAAWLRDVVWPHSVILEELYDGATEKEIRESEAWWIAVLEHSCDLLNACAPGSHRHW